MKKEKILKKIEELFFEQTFKEVSMTDIGNHLGIKKASLYYYFPSKEVLFEELLEYSFLNYQDFIISLIKTSEKDKKISDKNLQVFIMQLIRFPKDAKNIFSIASQNGYCQNKKFTEKIKEKYKIIFQIIHNSFEKKYNFSPEKTFLVISLFEDLARKKCLFGECDFEIENLIKEISLLFRS